MKGQVQVGVDSRVQHGLVLLYHNISVCIYIYIYIFVYKYIYIYIYIYIYFLVAEFISPQKVCTFSSIGDYRIPKSVKCAHSAPKGTGGLLLLTWPPTSLVAQ